MELEGDPAQGSNRDAIGSQILAWGPDDLYIWRAVTGGEGYLSQSTPEVELGLGRAKTVDLEIFWPGMRRQEFLNVKANQRIRIRQGSPEVEVLSAAPTPSP